MSIRVTLVGPNSSGKTSLVLRWTGKKIHPNKTMAIDCKSHSVMVDGKLRRIQLWDCSGDDIYKQMLSNYIKNSDFICIVFDLTDIKSWEQVPFWVEASQVEGQMSICIIGNKVDMESKRKVHNKNIRRYLKTLKSRLTDIYYLEVSAKTGENCKDTFQLIVRETSRKDIHEDPIYTSKDLKNDASSCTIV